jgi:hypothetical protein
MPREHLYIIDHHDGIFLIIGHRDTATQDWELRNIDTMLEILTHASKDGNWPRLEIVHGDSWIGKSIQTRYRQAGFGKYEKYVPFRDLQHPHLKEFGLGPSPVDETIFVGERHDNRSMPRSEDISA